MKPLPWPGCQWVCRPCIRKVRKRGNLEGIWAMFQECHFCGQVTNCLLWEKP